MKQRPNFAPPGTPFQVHQRTKRIERKLRHYAAELRRKADRIDRHAAKIEADRLAGKPIDRGLIMRAWDSGSYCVRYSVVSLTGLKPAGLLSDEATRDALVEMLFLRVIKSAAQLVVEPATQPPAGQRVIQLPSRAPAVDPAPVTPAPADPVAEAVAIARSARAQDIDWSQEPLTDRERKVRALFLERADPFTLLRINIELLLRRVRGRRELLPASDLQAALDRNRREAKELRRARDNGTFREIGDEIDGEEAA